MFVNEGTAHTWGLASFKSARRVVLTGRLNDVVPRGRLRRLPGRHRVPGGRRQRSPLHGQGHGGCKDKDGIAYSFDIRSSTRKITRLLLKLYECDTDGVCGGYGNEKYVSIDNPLH